MLGFSMGRQNFENRRICIDHAQAAKSHDPAWRGHVELPDHVLADSYMIASHCQTQSCN